MAFTPCVFSILRIRTDKILDELRDAKNGVVSFKRKLSSRKITKHQVGFTEADIDRDRQTIVSSDVQKGWFASPRGFTGGTFVDHALRN